MEPTITDVSGKHRLIIRSVPLGLGADFHSLVWEISNGSTSVDHIVITRADFQPPTKHRRWVSDLHSFDPAQGRAIIQVAEGDVPDGVEPVYYVYSWREWDLRRNREIRHLQTCKDPFEKHTSEG